jgi:hypothetical protein
MIRGAYLHAPFNLLPLSIAQLFRSGFTTLEPTQPHPFRLLD